ncbi:MAG: RHS repeat-associated core domain-containing protein, partial [Actinomycetota bacterium]
LVSSNLDYDLAGNVTSRAQTVNGAADSWTYQYDPAGRLTFATLNGGTTTEYRYDGAGNRYWVKEGAAAAVTTEFSSASHPVSSSDGTNYTTDELGNLTGISGGPDPNFTFAYDAWSQLKTATQGATTITYSTDAIGRMWQRSVAGAGTLYKYRGLSEDLVRVAPPTGDVTSYAYSAGGPLAQKIGTTSRLILRDLHGDVVGLTTTTGTVQGSRAFDPYGKPRSTTGESSALGFQGAPTDASTGLVDMVTRHYLPNLGRFITADQVFGNLMLPVSLNRFSYAVGNPVTFSDPDGMCANPKYCPAPTTSSQASAKKWYSTGATLNEPSYGESSGYRSYVNTVYLKRPEIRPPSFRPQFFNRLPNLLRDRGVLDTSHASYGCSGGRGWHSCGVTVEDEGGGVMGFLHTTLDVVGFIPVVGEVADGANAALYAVEGDWVNATIYAGAVFIPTSGKVLRAGKELVEEGIQVAAKSGDDLVGAACKLNSFAGHTLVLMASGKLQPISEVEVGDRVMAADPITHRMGPRRVTDVIVGRGTKELVDLRFANGERITATAGHPFWDERSRSWIEAEDLKGRHGLLKPSEEQVQLTGSREYTRRAAVYNLTVAGLHTFYVGRARALVHNCGDTPFTRAGRAAHMDASYPSGATKEAPLASGKRPDATDFGLREVYELKPNTASGISKGIRQLSGYLDELGADWTGFLVFYDPTDYM